MSNLHMKNIIFTKRLAGINTLLALTVCAGMLFAGCGARDNSGSVYPVSAGETQSSVSKTDDAGKKAYNSGKNAMKNPVVESTAKEILEKFGLHFSTPKGSSGVGYFIINDEIAEMQFKYYGRPCSFRACSALAFDDISGMHYKWQHETDGMVKGREAKIKEYAKGETHIKVCLWYDIAPGYMYSLSVSSIYSLDDFDIAELASQIFTPLQGES